MFKKKLWVVFMATLLLNHAVLASGFKDFVGTWQMDNDKRISMINESGELFEIEPDPDVKPQLFGKLEEQPNGEFLLKLDSKVLAIVDEKEREEVASGLRFKLKLNKENKLVSTWYENDKDGKEVETREVATSVNLEELKKTWSIKKNKILDRISGQWKLKDRRIRNYKEHLDGLKRPENTYESVELADKIEKSNVGEYQEDGKTETITQYEPINIEVCRDGRCILNEGQYETFIFVNCLTVENENPEIEIEVNHYSSKKYNCIPSLKRQKFKIEQVANDDIKLVKESSYILNDEPTIKHHSKVTYGYSAHRPK